MNKFMCLKMTDFKGNTLYVGDKVAFSVEISSCGGWETKSKLIEGKITGFNSINGEMWAYIDYEDRRFIYKSITRILLPASKILKL